jgi:hypothetical protein
MTREDERREEVLGRNDVVKERCDGEGFITSAASASERRNNS